MYIIGVIILSLSLMASTSDEREDTLNVASYNSKGFSDNRVEIIKELLAYNNIVFIQEHWQFEEQLHKLNIDNRHMAIAVSGMDSSSHIQLGRPYGGVAIIWDKNINKYIQSIDTESKRVAAVLFTNATDKLLFITVYMPCDTGVCDVNRAAEDFYDVLTEISRIVHVYGEYEVVIGGDFNTAYIRNNAHSTLLRNFCEDESLVNANMHKNADIDYTYCNYASGTTSVIDHFLLTEQAYDSIINVHVVHSGTNLSDHDPLILQIRAPHQTIKTSDECRSRKVNWRKATVIDLDAYSDAVSSNLLN